MRIPQTSWTDYIDRLSRINQKAGELMRKYIEQHGTGDAEALIRYAHALVTKYGEGSAELACQMYDAAAEASGVALPPAEPAETASREEVARMVNGNRNSPPNLQSGVSRFVKQAAADTTLKNAARDGAEWAWVPHGDTCPFCIMLASNGWQKASKRALEGGHAKHIHANCNCEYAVRFDSRTTVAGYDPEKYLAQYREAGGDLNEMRRMQYARNRVKINEQKRAAYALRLEINRKIEFHEKYAAKTESDRLSNYEHAVIERRKTTEYLLNPEHETGRTKAVAFRDALGYTKENAEALERELLNGLRKWKAEKASENQYGKKYEVRMMIHGPNGKTATVKTIWQFDEGSETPRLVTAYVYKERS